MNSMYFNDFYFDWCNIVIYGIATIGLVLSIIFGVILGYFGMFSFPILMLSWATYMIMGWIFIIDYTNTLKYFIGIVFVLGLVMTIISFMRSGQNE